VSRQAWRAQLLIMHTIRVNLAGGLGNQMFMYAAGRALAERTGGRLLLNRAAFRRDRVFKRVFLLDRFPVSATILPDDWSGRALDAVDSLSSACPWLVPGLTVIREPLNSRDAAFCVELLRTGEGRSVSLRGYWQDERYFRDYAGIIRREFGPPPIGDSSAAEYRLLIEQAPHPVAVCIRFFREVPGETSEPGMIIAAFRRVVAEHARCVPGCQYFVFTEEPSYFGDPMSLGVYATVVKNGSRNEDAPTHLHLISLCRTFFIGYSSFHWWGAWLGEHACKKVTYLHFPGRRGADYAAAGWNVVDVA
jgi:hypothetical protein